MTNLSYLLLVKFSRVEGRGYTFLICRLCFLTSLPQMAEITNNLNIGFQGHHFTSFVHSFVHREEQTDMSEQRVLPDELFKKSPIFLPRQKIKPPYH